MVYLILHREIRRMQRTSMEAQPWARATGDHLHAVIFVVFFWSGFCSLVYQVVWIRLAFSHFGVLTPVLSCESYSTHRRPKAASAAPGENDCDR